MLKSIKWEIWYLLIGIFYESINSIYMICFIDSQIFTIFVTQCSITVFSGRIKRESGVNPGQSRCCKLHNVPDWSPLFLFNGKAPDMVVSQKTCFAHNFKSFEERLLKHMNHYIVITDSLLFLELCFMQVFNYLP